MKLENIGLIINYRTLLVGGIETNIVKIVKFFLEHNKHVIWLHSPHAKIADEYNYVMRNERIDNYEINVSGYHWLKVNKHIELKECPYLMLSFNVHDQLRAIELSNRYKNIYPAYFVPHFNGQLTFPEVVYSDTLFYKIFNQIYGKFYQLLDNWNQLYFFGQKHINAIEKRYNFLINSPEEKLCQGLIKPPSISVKEIEDRAKSRKGRFVIISVGRMEFPHKGYMVGLMDIYSKLKVLYPNLELWYVGDGAGISILKEKEIKLFPGGNSNIKYYGSVSPDKLPSLFKQAHLNVSVAGGFTQGVRNGLLSIPARHYSYKCELYGLPPKNLNYGLEDIPGSDGESLIEECINMSDERYVELSVKGFNETIKNYKYNPNYFFEIPKKMEIAEVPLKYKLLMKFTWYVEKIHYYFNHNK